MKTLVVYDSLHGNTREIAHAMGETFPGGAAVLQVGQVEAPELETAVFQYNLGDITFTRVYCLERC